MKRKGGKSGGNKKTHPHTCKEKQRAETPARSRCLQLGGGLFDQQCDGPTFALLEKASHMFT
jgi:hypothetical protein